MRTAARLGLRAGLVRQLRVRGRGAGRRWRRHRDVDAWVQDGLALLTRVKASPATRYLPIVIATADEPAAVVAHALALGADDVFVLPIADAELQARTRALARLAAIEIERRRDALLAHYGVPRIPESPGVPAIDRIGILLIGPAGGDQIQVLVAQQPKVAVSLD